MTGTETCLSEKKFKQPAGMALNFVLPMKVLLLFITIILVWLTQTIDSAPLSSYLVSSFTSPDPTLPFNHITFNNITGDVYIGARERLYQLNSDLTLKHTVDTGSCSGKYEENINNNKLLVIAPSPENKLITCGGCDGFCETRSLTNISHNVGRYDSGDAYRVVTTEDAPTVGSVVLGADFVRNGEGTPNAGLYLFTGVSFGSGSNPSVAKHNLVDLFRHQNVQEKASPPRNGFFQHVIAYLEYLYYFITRENTVYLGRLCRNSLDSAFASYTEIELECESHDEIQTAHIGPAGSQLADSFSINITDDLLYAVFTSGSSSALCIYRMKDVLQRFEDAVLGCIQGDTSKGTTNDNVRGSTCNSFTFTPPDSVQCTAYQEEDGIVTTYYQYASGVVPLSASPIITIPDVMSTSIVTTIERQHTVAFMGDSEGCLHKLNIVNSSFGYVYETVTLGSGIVLQEMFLNESMEQLTLATSSDQGSKVLTLEVVNCGQYQTCDECIGGNGGSDGDPYCGWCTLEARCTRYEECPLSDESTRWLSYNALQCVSISAVQPSSLPYHQTEQEITITVQQLPDLRDSFQYMCAFDSYEVLASTTGNTLTCTSPPEDRIPTIPDGSGHVTLKLSIMSTETDISFVSADFDIFDCATITSCSSCVTSPYPCDWCVYDDKCTDDRTSCQSGDTVVIGENNPVGSGNIGQGFCPQLLGTTDTFLIPVNIPLGFSLLAKNLPTDQSKGEIIYECILHIEGEEVRVSSPIFNETYILCNYYQYLYNENILQKNVSVSVQWNGQNNIDDLSGSYVTLYKCSVNSGSCSQCLSQEATPPVLKCGWCGNDCNVIQSDVCQNNRFLRQNETQFCSAPVITDFYPLSGPVNGRTRLEIKGTDIGVEFDDVLQILIQDLECDLTDMGMYYQPGQSVSCMTGIAMDPTSGRIKITVMSGTGNKTGETSEEFQYRDPVVTGFNPREGPVAGGTAITISGMYLDTGRNIMARFGEAECVEISVGDTVATCVTSSIPQNQQVSLPLTMIFDGVERTFTDYAFTYMPNPRIEGIDRTETIVAGGTDITLTGERFDLIQEPRIVVTSLTTNASNYELCNGTATLLICPTPSFPDDVISVRRRRAIDGALEANLTFDFDGNIIDGGIIEYYPDPFYENFTGENRIYESNNKRLEIKGRNLNLASKEDDVQVLLGPDGVCSVDDLENDTVRCELPDKKPRPGNINGTIEEGAPEDLPAVTVIHGNLMFYPGYVRDSTSTPNIGGIVGGVIGAAFLISVILFIIGALIFRRNHDKLTRQAQQFEMLEKKIQTRVETAFHELQADMSEVEEQISHLGVPFVNALNYSKNMLFSGLAVLPASSDPEYLNSDLERAMIMFSRQLSNSDILTRFIQELEEKRHSQRRDRVNIASLITILLVTEGKFGYFTETLFKLLEENIEAGAESRRAKSLFRRTETIVEKLLSNWITLCMYRFLKRHVAESLYLLYQSIKIQVEKGPIDITTGQSVYSLNFECLLEEDVEFNELTLSVVGSNKQHLYYVKVLDVDCITQVKQKILDAAYRRSHIVQQNRAHEMDLLWYHPGGEERILKDTDEFNKTVGNTKDVLINTIKTYGVEDGSQVALILRAVKDNGVYHPVTPGVQLFPAYLDQAGPDDVRERDYIRIRTLAGEGSRIIHLVTEDQITPSSSSKTITKLDREFLAPRLLVTKKTIQPRLDEFLAGVFKKPDQTPHTIKHLFDFFDKMAQKYCPEKSEQIAEAWKNNCLPLHYWMTTLAHPCYIFDMRQSRSADQSVSVLANMLDNACKKVRSENTQVSALNRVLFYKDLPGHIRTISEYFESIKSSPTPTTEELQENFEQITQDFSGLFSRVGTLKNLYDFTCQDTADLLDSGTEPGSY